jgi:hypothetical protein
MTPLGDRIRRLNGERLATITQGKPFAVIAVDETAVLIAPRSTDRARRIPRPVFERAAQQGLATVAITPSQVLSTNPTERNSSYVASILRAAANEP